VILKRAGKYILFLISKIRKEWRFIKPSGLIAEKQKYDFGKIIFII
jgi:hypothetical protein